MTKRYTQVPIGYLEPIFNKWLSTFSGGEILNIYFIPMGDLVFRAIQFAEWAKYTYDKEIETINLETELIVNPEHFKEVLEKYKTKNILIIAKREFFQPDGLAMAAVLEEWYARYGKGIIVLHEGFPSELREYVSSPVLQQKSLIHRIYPTEVIKAYIRSTAELFGVEVTEKWIERAAVYCGGIPWLINDLLRHSDDQNLFSDSSFIWKVEQIARSIPDSEGIQSDLIAFGLQNNLGEWLPAFGEYFSNMNRKKLIISENKIIWGNIDVSREFSPGELAILNIGQKTAGVVTRDQVGNAFWGEQKEEKYSDWALDAVISRLRIKLNRLHLPIQIKTFRGRGYVFSI